MRTFSSYGQINRKLHYYAPRTELIDKAYRGLLGEVPDEGGPYLTVWAPRQTGKSSVMLEVTRKIQQSEDFDVALFSMQSAKNVHSVEGILNMFVKELQARLDVSLPTLRAWEELPALFSSNVLSRPLILILDEFDALDEEFINAFANEFRKIYSERANALTSKGPEKPYLLHGLALIGIRSVLGIEHVSGSPFNVQQSLHIPNLTFQEVEELFHWYQQESRQRIEPEVIESLYDEARGHPGLTCWFGELLTQTYNENSTAPITLEYFEEVYAAAVKTLPNNTILNILSKAKQEPYRQQVLTLFRTERKIDFNYDDPEMNYLYLNGVVDQEKANRTEFYTRFSSPFVQKRLFNYFAKELFDDMGKLYEPFENLSDIISSDSVHIPKLMARFEKYLKRNREWLLKDAPRRKDLRIFEAVFHFSLYRYLCDFLGQRQVRVQPEFPTGNGKIDLILDYRGTRYGLELKSYTDESGYQEAIKQAAGYGDTLGLDEIFLVVFVDDIDERSRKIYEIDTQDEATGITVRPVFVETGS